jgi:hypothetical protein
LSFFFKAWLRVKDALAKQLFWSICGGAQRTPKRMAPQLGRGLSALNPPVTLP